MRWRSTLLALTLVCLPAVALATVAADLPCGSSDPCVVSTSIAVTDGSTLDFGARGVLVTASGDLDAGGGTMTINAGSLVLQPGGRLTSAGGQITVTTTGDIAIQASSVVAKVDVTGPSGGYITFTAGGALDIAGRLLALATLTMGDGGSVDVTGATATLAATGKITAAGGSGGFGGDVSVFASTGSVTIAGAIDTSSGNDGGYVSIEGTTDVTTTKTAVVNAKAGQAGSADAVDIAADNGAVSLDGVIDDSAPGSPDLGGGSGGDVSVDAATTIESVATIDVSAGGVDGLAGSVDLETDGDIIVRGAIDGSASGSLAAGGLITFGTTAGMIDVGGNITAFGALGGGEISAFSFNTVRVTGGKIVADGPFANIALTGCAVSVASAASLSAQGTNASNLVQASGQMTIAGPLVGGENGNRLEYLDATKPPIVTFAPVPTPTIVKNTALIPCGGVTTTTTTTTTMPGGTTTTIVGGSTTTVAHTTTTSTTVTTTTATTSAPSSTTTGVATTSTTRPSEGVCAPGACDDGDDCTDDACDPASGCLHTPRPGLDLVSCRLDLLATGLAVAPTADVGGVGARARYSAKVGKARRLVEASRRLAGRRQVVKLRRASHLLDVFIGLVRKGAARGKVASDLADHLLGLAAGAVESLAPMTQ